MSKPPMMDAEPSRVDPARKPVDAMEVPRPLDLQFEGWSPEVFEMLGRIRANPHIEQYNEEKPGVTTHLKDPFKHYRDDLVVNWVLPNRLKLETEKNVFSRLLKNDFGAGGCHDNLWMSFYRPHTKRLKDVQVSHSISPDGLDVGIYVGSYAEDLLDQALTRIRQAPETYLDLVNPLLQKKEWRFYYHAGSGTNKRKVTHRTPLDALPDDLDRADGIWLRTRFPREQVLDWGPDVVRHALDAVLDVWPIYRFYLAERFER
jgi:hypothetical protein